jgi:hypothetical protein
MRRGGEREVELRRIKSRDDGRACAIDASSSVMMRRVARMPAVPPSVVVRTFGSSPGLEEQTSAQHTNERLSHRLKMRAGWCIAVAGVVISARLPCPRVRSLRTLDIHEE